MIEKIAMVLSSQYAKLGNEDWEKLTPEEREFHSGMVCQLQNVIMDLGVILQVPDMSQWYYDCGMRICGSKQYTCESCEKGESI